MKRRLLLLLAAIFIVSFFSGVYASSFTGDTIYLIMTDRFFDGDKTNNFGGEIFSQDKKDWKLYWGGDFQGIIDKIPYLKSLGVTAIWITPVVENTEKLYWYGGDEKIAGYHGYWAKDFKKINPHFGTLEKFKELVDTCHKNGIKVILDIVLNHTSPAGQGIDGALYYDGKLLGDYSHDAGGYFHHNGSIDFSKDKDLGNYYYRNLLDLADLSQDNPYVYEMLKDCYLFWLDTGIDGFRLDTVKYIPPFYLNDFVKSMKQKKDVFVFGEWYDAGPENDLACFYEKKADIPLIDFSNTHYMKEVFVNDNSFKVLEDYYKVLPNFKYVNEKVNFIDNHDMPRIMSLLSQKYGEEEAEKRTQIAVYTMMLTPGIPCIYYGTEQFMHKDIATPWGFGSDPYNRQMMESFKLNNFGKNLKKLSDLRKENPAVSEGDIKVLEADKDVFVFERNYNGSSILFAANKGPKKRICLKNLNIKDGYYSKNNPECQTVIGENIEVKDAGTVIELDKYETGVYANK
ncbi:MAG: alpha-amylase family glycosyl hydrolase [Armatimonadota bacterium]